LKKDYARSFALWVGAADTADTAAAYIARAAADTEAEAADIVVVEVVVVEVVVVEVVVAAVAEEADIAVV